jgi:hypothetical protein
MSSNNEQWNAQLKKTIRKDHLMADFPSFKKPTRYTEDYIPIYTSNTTLEGVISNHCGINPKDVELLENLYRAAWEARKRRIESKEYKKKMINLITNKEN